MDLTLSVKKENFDLIKSGKKTVEYREVKPYWTKRLEGKDYNNIIITLGYPKKDDLSKRIKFKYNGYGHVSIFHKQFDGEKITKVYEIYLSERILGFTKGLRCIMDKVVKSK